MQPELHRNNGSNGINTRNRIWQTPFLAILVLITGLGLSLLLAIQSAQSDRERLQERFHATTMQTTQGIQEKADRFSLLLMAGRGMVLNNDTLPPHALNERWHRMFDSYPIDYTDLGLVGLSFTQYIPAHERDQLIADFNRSSTRTLRIFPPPPAGQPSLAILHLVPRSIENRMQGYDLMSEDKRRMASLEAIRNNRVTLSQPLSLLPTDVNSLDYLQILPVRMLDNDGHTLGIITAGFSMSTLITSSLSDLQIPLRIQLVDPRTAHPNPSFDSHPQQPLNTVHMSKTSTLNIGGQPLTLRISNLDLSANHIYLRRYDTAILVSGLSITLLLTLALMFFIITRQQAVQLSHTMSSRAEEMYQRYRSLFTQSPEAIVVHVDGIVELANQHAARLFGCNSPEELYHCHIKDLVHADSLAFAYRRREALTQGQHLEPAEQKLIRLNGQAFTAEVSSALTSHKGQDAIQVVFRDITHEKQQRLEARIATIVFSHCRDAIMVTNTEGKIELVNKAFEELTGYTAKSINGRTPDALNAGHHNSDFFYALWSSLKSSGQWRGDIVNRHRNGHLYIQDTDIIALHDENQQASHFICLMRDVTEQRSSSEYFRLRAEENAGTG
ncbi:MAG: PAS domain S-box protein [Oceanospirillales bacterium]|nr:PAS domain S-box protein [Oceanospirillales bacterium]